MISSNIATRGFAARPLQSERRFSATSIAVRVCGPSHGGSHRSARDRAPVALFTVPDSPASGLFPVLTPSSIGKNRHRDPRLGDGAGTFSVQRGAFANAIALGTGGMQSMRQNTHAPSGLGR